MTTQTKSLADLLPAQEHYYLLHDGVKFARHGTPEAIGLLVFEDRERADQFCLTVGNALPAFKPVRVDVDEFMRLVEEVGAVCVVDGVKVFVGTLRPLRSRPGTQPESEPHPANPEGVVPKDPNWVPADQIPAVVEAQLDDDVLPCGCPVDPLEIKDAQASLIEEARVAACDDRDDVCEILEGGPIDSENRSSAGIELRANPAPLSPTEGRTFPEYVPDEWDMKMLARAYLDKAIDLHCYYFFTGACDAETEAMRLTARFEDVAKYLGQAKRQEIIDLVDKRGYETSGDEWEAFKSSSEGFWSTPADREAILRLAASLPDDLSRLDIGAEYYEVLEQARGGKK